ncbi:MAG TPA: choice-of-anchor Q domain-containing protein, partial [Chloroflexota bacterium]|nr:choice-of-anchor Q domain-containing protein [Chloroflexota bacterium]
MCNRQRILRLCLLGAVLGGMLIMRSSTAQAAGTVIGSGTVASCQAPAAAAALTTAVSVGGVITFSCGGGPVTIPLTSHLTISANTTLDGTGQQVTIHGPGPVVTVRSGIVFTALGLTITGGAATFGGGIRNNGGTVTLINSTLSGNTANGPGGGGMYTSSGTVTLINSTISGNAIPDNNSNSGLGAGIFIQNGTVTLIDSTISGNTGGFFGGGGGIANYGGTVTLINSTLSNNSDGIGGGIYNNGGTVTLANTILAGNTLSGGGPGPDCDGSLTSQGYNSIGTTSGCTVSATTGDLFDQEPTLGALANNGGPTQTMALQASSLGIDAIPPAHCTLHIDQRGYVRPGTLKTGASRTNCDIGAYETNSTPDTTKPTCSVNLVVGPPAQATFTCQDPIAGLAEMLVTKEVNATNLAPAFTVGQTTPGTVTFTKSNQSQQASVGIQVTDLAGNIATFDPLFTSISQDGHRPTLQLFNQIAPSDHLLHIANGSP